MKDLHCIIVDDERLARVELKAILDEVGGCQVLAQAGNAASAKPLIESLQPDVLFLDINMPGTSGFELLNQLNYCPFVVFVTAYDQYAIKAFEVHALDYLMKPVPAERLAATLQQVRARLGAGAEAPGRIFIPARDGGKFLALGQVYLVRAYDHYLRLYHPAGTDLIHQRLSGFAQRLPSSAYFQINRSEIVRIDAVKNIRALSRGRYSLTLPGEEEVVVSEKRAVVWRRELG
ncbi:MAG: LytTR family DNA-binding domain-containing protein [Bacteroidota bacterium]